MHEFNRAYQLQTERSALILAAALDNANFAIKSTMLINGGASIAILAFIGQLHEGGKEEFDLANLLMESLVYFAIGAGISSMAMVCAYFANYFYFSSAQTMSISNKYPYIHNNFTSNRWNNTAIFFHVLGIVFVIMSISIFIYSAILIRNAII